MNQVIAWSKAFCSDLWTSTLEVLSKLISNTDKRRLRKIAETRVHVRIGDLEIEVERKTRSNQN